jgi:TRAP-type C4-dicarboxylate transport system permease small subunit
MAIETSAGNGSSPGLRLLDKGCELVVALALIAMAVIIIADVFTRNALGYSLQISDEICGYLLVAVTFMSMSVSHTHGTFHRVKFVQARLSERSRLISQVAFDVVALVVCAVLDWQFIRLEFGAWVSGSMAPTIMMTPLWIPQLSMPIGGTLVCLALARTIVAKARRLTALCGIQRAG